MALKSAGTPVIAGCFFLTSGAGDDVIICVSGAADNERPLNLAPVLCIDRDAFDRFGRVLRYLVVGMVDQAISPRLLSSDARVEQLMLGPVQTLVHQPLVWPMVGKRTDQIAEVLSHQTPTLIHAVSSASYALAATLATSFDADLIFQVTSTHDCDEIARIGTDRVGHYLPFSTPLAHVLETQLGIKRDRIEVTKPGLLSGSRIACFANPDRQPTLLCLSSFEKGSGVDLLIDAMALLARQNHKLLLFLLGEGRQESALRRRVHEQGLSESITFAHPGGDVSQAMQGADIFVRPSGDTAFSEDTLQAMGAGLAVVSYEGPVCDHYHDDETALICGKSDAHTLAAAIERLVVDRTFARSLAAGGNAYVREHHAMSAMASTTTNVYRSLALARTTFPISE